LLDFDLYLVAEIDYPFMCPGLLLVPVLVLLRVFEFLFIHVKQHFFDVDGKERMRWLSWS